MRIQLTLSEATGNELKRRANEFGMNVSVLAEHVLREWIRRERSITLTVTASVQPKKDASTTSQRQVNDGSRPTYGLSASTVEPDEGDEDTMQCKDCAQIVPLSGFTPGMEHRDCEEPGANLVALRARE